MVQMSATGARRELVQAGIIDDAGLLKPDWNAKFVASSRTLPSEAIREFALIAFKSDDLVRDLLKGDDAVATLPQAAQLKSFGMCASQANAKLKAKLDQPRRTMVVEEAEKICAELASNIAPINLKITADTPAETITLLERAVKDLQEAIGHVNRKISFTWAPEESTKDGINDALARMHFTFGRLNAKLVELQDSASGPLKDAARILANGLRELAERSASKVEWGALHGATLRAIGLEGAVWSDRWPELVTPGPAPSFDALSNTASGKLISVGTQAHVDQVVAAGDPTAIERRHAFDPKALRVEEHTREMTEAQIKGAEKKHSATLDRPLHEVAALAALGTAHVNAAWAKHFKVPTGAIPAEVRISPGGSGGKDLWGMVMKLAIGPGRQINVHTTGGKEAAEDSQVRDVHEQMALIKLANSEGFDRLIDVAREDPSAFLGIARFLKMRTSLDSVAQVQSWTRGQLYALEDHQGRVQLFHGRFRPLSAKPVSEGFGGVLHDLVHKGKSVEELKEGVLEKLTTEPVRWVFELSPVRKGHDVDTMTIPNDIPNDVAEGGWAAFMVLDIPPADYGTLSTHFQFADRDVYAVHDGHAPGDLVKWDELPDHVKTRMDKDADTFLSPMYTSLGVFRAHMYGTAANNRGCPVLAARQKLNDGASIV